MLLGIDELVILCGDIKQLEVWLLGSYCTLALQTLTTSSLVDIDKSNSVNIISGNNIPTVSIEKNDSNHSDDIDSNNIVTTSIITQVS